MIKYSRQGTKVEVTLKADSMAVLQAEVTAMLAPSFAHDEDTAIGQLFSTFAAAKDEKEVAKVVNMVAKELPEANVTINRGSVQGQLSGGDMLVILHEVANEVSRQNGEDLEDVLMKMTVATLMGMCMVDDETMKGVQVQDKAA